TNPFFPPIIRGAEEAARERGYELVLCNTDDEAEREKASLRVLRERQADGLLIATSRMADATLASVRRERFPFVLVNRGSRFAANDLLALGALRAARETGLPVPAELSLVGINDIPMVNLLDPPLTTARVPQREMGAIAARMLIGLLEREPVVDRHVLLDTELIVRGSTAAPRSADRRVA